MFHYARWKIIGILGSVLISLLIALPNVLPTSSQEYVANKFGLHPLTLGLDLQGGSNILMEVDRKDMIDKLEQQLTGDIRATLREAKIGYSGISKTDGGVTVRITKLEDLDKAKIELTKLVQPLNGGLFGSTTPVNLYVLGNTDQQYNFTVDPAGLEAKITAAIHQSLKIVESRINGTGTTEPIIQQQGKDRISVEIPGLQDPEKVKNLLGSTAKLTFQLLCPEQQTSTNQAPPPDCKGLPQKADVDRITADKKTKGENN